MNVFFFIAITFKIFIRDDEAKFIERILPVHNSFVNLLKTKESDCRKSQHFSKNLINKIGITLIVNDEKINLKFLSDEDCVKFTEVTKKP